MRLTPREGEEMLLHGDPIALGRLADAERHRRYPSDRVTFIIDRNINYTNVCVNECRFCAFFRRQGSRDAYLLSYDEILDKVRETVARLHQTCPDLVVDGDMQANFAINNDLLTEHFPFSKLADGKGPANTLIFPYLTAGNIAYKLMQELGGAEAIGPILNGLSKSVHVLQMGSSVNEIVNMTAIAVIDAQLHETVLPAMPDCPGVPV